ASLLAMTVDQSTEMLNGIPSSRAGSLPQSFTQLFKVVTARSLQNRISKINSIKSIAYEVNETVTAHFLANCRLTEHSFSMASSRITSGQTQ
ncbi:hypothetical protein, partial [Pseudomonas sp.]|uniref:hypothetical protein n=1 Tax=Pseudomonas sp. TaxID=306 RepID=UPI003F38B239